MLYPNSYDFRNRYLYSPTERSALRIDRIEINQNDMLYKVRDGSVLLLALSSDLAHQVIVYSCGYLISVLAHLTYLLSCIIIYQ